MLKTNHYRPPKKTYHGIGIDQDNSCSMLFNRIEHDRPQICDVTCVQVSFTANHGQDMVTSVEISGKSIKLNFLLSGTYSFISRCEVKCSIMNRCVHLMICEVKCPPSSFYKISS